MKTFKNIPVLITGAEGFIGSHLARRLAREGAGVTALVCPGASPERLAQAEGDIRVFPLDIRNPEALTKIVTEVKPQKIFHLAAVTDVGRSRDKIELALSVNLGGTVNLLSALSRIEYEIVVSAGTAESYGRNAPPFREDMPLDPISPYSFSKAAATLFCRMSASSLGASVRVLRLFLVYGPGQGEERFLPQLIRAGLSGRPFRMTAGEQTREYTYIDDVIEGFLSAAQEKGKGEVFNLGSGEEISLRALVGKVEAILGKNIVLEADFLPYREQEIWRLVGDHTKAAAGLKWRAATPLETGLARTIEWYKMVWAGGV